MSALDVAQRYFDGWNQHDAGFLVATFDPDGDGTRLPPGLRGVMLDRSEDLSVQFASVAGDRGGRPAADVVRN